MTKAENRKARACIPPGGVNRSAGYRRGPVFMLCGKRVKMQRSLQLKIIRAEGGELWPAARHAAQRVIRKGTAVVKRLHCAAPGTAQRTIGSTNHVGTVFTGRGDIPAEQRFCKHGSEFLSWSLAALRKGRICAACIDYTPFQRRRKYRGTGKAPQASAAMANNISITSGGMRTARRGLASH